MSAAGGVDVVQLISTHSCFLDALRTPLKHPSQTKDPYGLSVLVVSSWIDCEHAMNYLYV
jgi:hypothetical protein